MYATYSRTLRSADFRCVKRHVYGVNANTDGLSLACTNTHRDTHANALAHAQNTREHRSLQYLSTISSLYAVDA